MKKFIKRSVIICILIVGIISVTGWIMAEKDVIFTESKNVVSERVLVPGGQSVGIEMSIKGALIVGVENNSGPEPGDMIIAVNNHQINEPSDVDRIVNEGDGSSIDITVLRNQRKINYSIDPYMDIETKKYKLGLWIKEKIAGIGTLTLYDPKTNKFALLGHGIYEPETGILLENNHGKLLKTKVDKITSGEVGKPGEIGGTIYNFETPLGNIEKNTVFGIYASADNSQKLSLSEPMVMGTQSQITTGRAYIMTTIEGTKPQRYEIKITGINRQRNADTKGIEFQVTDRTLIDTCGGIIQGMSGSPIIQNNRIIGAVTHVFVDNPQKGYGVFVEWMVEEIEK